ncbi:methyltransferase [Thiolapillus sp.]
MKQPLTASVLLRILFWLVLLLGGLALGFYLDKRLFPQALTSLPWHLASALPGLLLIRLVFRMARNTGRTLARLGRDGDLPRLETNRLVTQGPYGCMRHPMHLGLLPMPLALALLAGSPSFILFLAPVEMALMVVLVLLLEEREALHKFGDAYREYRRQVPAFSLRPSCLKRLLQPVKAKHGNKD